MQIIKKRGSNYVNVQDLVDLFEATSVDLKNFQANSNNTKDEKMDLEIRLRSLNEILKLLKDLQKI